MAGPVRPSRSGSGITVVVTTVGEPRRAMLRRALESVWSQTLQPDQVVVAQDTQRYGAAWNRQLGHRCVRTPLVAYLDDDDEFYPTHLERLHAEMLRTGADLVYPWFDVFAGVDPFPMFYELPWDNARPHQIPVTFLARTEAISEVGGWYDGVDPDDPSKDPDGNRAGEDWRLTMRLVERDAKIVHLPERTWRWHHDSGNTSGQPSRVTWERV